jgi:type III secretion system FlhB-like substrate exporter
VTRAAERLTALGHGEVAEALTELAERLRDEE